MLLMFTMDPPPFVPQGSEYTQGVYGQYPNKVNSPGFVNNYNYCNQRNNLAYHPNQNGSVNQSPRSMSEPFQGTNFGEDEFEIPPLTLPSVPTTVGDSNLPTVTMGDNLPNQTMGYSGSPEGNSRSPGAQNQGSPQMQQHQQVAMSPNIRQQTPDPSQPSSQSHSPPAAHPTMGHNLTDSVNSFSGAMPAAQNYEVHEVTSSTFSDHVPQISESLTDISNSTQMSLNPQFPPHGLNIPPITESSANWIPEIGTNPPYTSMNNSLPVSTTSHLQQSYPSQHQPLGHAPSPHMVGGGYHPAGQMPPDTILTTTYQSAISSVNSMPQMGMQPSMGTMQPPMQIPGQPGGPLMGTRISPPQRESSEDSDDNTPLSQFAAKQHHQQQQRVQPTPPPEVKETKKKPQKRKRKKDPNEPQKPVSAYALFFRDTQAAIKGSNPNASFGEVSKIVASMWDSLEAEQKQAYKQKTETAKREYLKKLAAYRASLVSKAAVEIEPVDQIPSKQKKGGNLASPMYHMNPATTVSPLMPMVPRAIAPKPVGNSPNLPMGHGAMLPSGGMMQPMHPMTQHMGSWYNPAPRYDATHAGYASVYDDSRDHPATLYTQWLHPPPNLQPAVGQ
ncbi:TOX high mobility group box family member 3 [Holothuria leucospilota]|uniref:TOX high mobility group box family member 3 n=1 Tax=Holothuria leucospilota TaxID=206669 RepID=A0A9Q1CAA6_HOLLE|nr:TOX high mobility group box family member 3 [Holothuria leucospilota]